MTYAIIKTDKQRQAYKLLRQPYMYYLFDGGARSGKSHLLCYYVIQRCLQYPGTRHLIGRYKFNHAKASIWKQTLLPLLKHPSLKGSYNINKTDLIIEFINGSEIWLAGFDDADRSEKIFGQEFATEFLNEIVQIPYDTVQNLKSRLNFKDIPLKFIGDTNPRAPTHWVHRLFIEHRDPTTLEAIPKQELYCRLSMNPYDNEANINKDYIENNLETLSGIKKKRLLEGIWCESAEGLVYRFSREQNHADREIPYQTDALTICGIDFGIAADVFIIWFQMVEYVNAKGQFDMNIHIIDEYVNNNQDYKHYVDVIDAREYKNVRYYGDPAGRSRDAKLESWFSLLRAEGIPIESPGRSTVAEMIDNTNNMMKHISVNETQCPKMVEMFENWSHPKDKDGKVVEGALPEHNVYSHPGTAFYYAMTGQFPVNKGENELLVM